MYIQSKPRPYSMAVSGKLSVLWYHSSTETGIMRRNVRLVLIWEQNRSRMPRKKRNRRMVCEDA